MQNVPAPVASGTGARTSYGVFIDRAEQAYRGIAAVAGRAPETGAIVRTTLDRAKNDSAAAHLTAASRKLPGTRSSFLLLNSANDVLVFTTGAATLRGDQDLLSGDATMPASQIKALVYGLVIDRLLASGHSIHEIMEFPLPTSYQLSAGHLVKDPEYPHPIALRDAVIRSRNAPAYYVINRLLTPADLSAFAHTIGVELPAIPSIAVGTTGVSQIALTTAFSTLLLRGGSYRPRRFVLSVTTPRGDSVLYNGTPDTAGTQRVFSAVASAMLNELLREVVYLPSGTGHRLITTQPDLLDLDPTAKTGSSSGSAWGFRGVTGTIGDQLAFSILIQGRHLPLAGRVAAPVVADLLTAITSSSARPAPTTLSRTAP